MGSEGVESEGVENLEMESEGMGSEEMENLEMGSEGMESEGMGNLGMESEGMWELVATLANLSAGLMAEVWRYEGTNTKRNLWMEICEMLRCEGVGGWVECVDVTVS